MGWIRTVLGEVYGLFVDDGWFAVTILGWLVVAGVALPRLGVPAGVGGVVLFLGLAGILVESVVRRARR
jgi:hypothetical protein